MTAGATEALAAAVLALTGPGDEVLTLEPFYDAYAAVAALAGAVLVPVPLAAPDFQPDPIVDPTLELDVGRRLVVQWWGHRGRTSFSASRDGSLKDVDRGGL